MKQDLNAENLIRVQLYIGAAIFLCAYVWQLTGLPIELIAMALGILYASLTIQFYLFFVAFLFGKQNSWVGLIVCAVLKLLGLAGLLIYAWRGEIVSIISCLVGFGSFIPATILLAIRCPRNGHES